MPKSSILNVIGAWEKALANARANAMDIPGMDTYLPPLEQILAKAKDLSARLDMRNAVKQQESVDRRALIREGNLQISRIRSAVKAFYGPNSERVIEFGARPVRPRTKKTQQDPAPPPVEAPGNPVPPPPAGEASQAHPAAAPDGKDTK
jgi:hypothetical protein